MLLFFQSSSSSSSSWSNQKFLEGFQKNQVNGILASELQLHHYYVAISWKYDIFDFPKDTSQITTKNNNNDSSYLVWRINNTVE